MQPTRSNLKYLGNHFEGFGSSHVAAPVREYAYYKWLGRRPPRSNFEKHVLCSNTGDLILCEAMETTIAWDEMRFKWAAEKFISLAREGCTYVCIHCSGLHFLSDMVSSRG